MSKIYLSFIALSTMLLLPSCVSVQQFYAGEPKPKEEVAILKSENKKSYSSGNYNTNSHAYITKVNGKDVKSGAFKRIALIPGMYTVKIHYYRKTELSQQAKEL